VRQGYVLQRQGAEAEGPQLGSGFVGTPDAKVAVANGSAFAVGA
jgi:hypothetical protein